MKTAVTGAFGYTGQYIARRLLDRGDEVVTLTGHPRPDERIRAFPFSFYDPPRMAESLAGCRVLYNTYWVRFDRGAQTYANAIRNTLALLKAAEMAGVERIVHVSITNPSLDSPLPYFRGKAILEDEIRKSRLSYAIVRPTVIFGPEDILVNNLAFLLRRFPVFLIPGSGQYRLQPVFVEDMTRIAVEAADRADNLVLDAVGPETFTFDELVCLIARTVGSRARILRAPPGLALFGARVLGLFLRDVLLTSDEVDGLMAGLLVSRDPPAGTMRLTEWLSANAGQVGRTHTSELQRHYAN